ncbi:methylthioribose-1-phosphate isomerase [Parabacteroides sp. PF5-5]|uniref:S-methyl-5-thioribose-1-phosphate isomerase n=1 Tax=unclassified Parabacteroides TaxID=2649774 RepID=UPI002475D45A|nr:MULTISPECIES: S-methyl-5-thioribose-1-phosphate isomerase [unclassified Parabacteroides]MDH6305403.1 methylthioribose-1-phosphate isomerase [Parabacteroides sp. PH5-39]MDH6316113.1 methylthioribose-1-phosphate isomerase [Parabacteroides sp. PF5-13]MDH6320263.1 methylthioribose-1-phosphate isomerase [Parabacteroides sp. PH5-13]MDH6323993.1 methylthioribose-1-phosphate isomerase [Parabacteroides sp. PH5-8]MDH6327304.1 methylthioribose-1-phosphate isomerase [Parabacteroides sp. PH5-41]
MQNLLKLKTVSLNKYADTLIILDQMQLPEKEVYLYLTSPEEVWDAIYQLKVRGAPAIGIAAAYGIYVCCRQIETASYEVFLKEFQKIKTYLAGSRPTAVNLIAALDRMEQVVLLHVNKPIPEIKQLLRVEAENIREEDAKACRQIGEYGLSLLEPDMGILTHCNAGHLAVSEYGTALAPIYLGQERGYGFKVFADETRPLLQGARLTAYELQQAGVDVTLICDNMAASVMQKGWVQAVLVGCDCIAANGDVANKVGTSGLAVLADYYHIPFYVLGPTTTLDRSCPDGRSIVIEERKPEEVTEMWYAHRMAPADVKVFNPAFDVTPHSLITAIITEKGIVYPHKGVYIFD